MIGSLILFVGRILLEVFGILFVRHRTKWSSGSLYGINILSHDSLSFYGLLFMRPFLLKISSCTAAPFRLISAFYIGVVGKMLVTYFLIAC
jgi:hypothetical protein